MKRTLLFFALTALAAVFSTGCKNAGKPAPNALALLPVSQYTLEDIAIRDPCILADSASGTYYLYAATSKEERPRGRAGVKTYKSKDLKTWEGPYPVFEIPEDSWANPGQGVWAPEVHAFRGKYYLLATLHNNQKPLGVQKDTTLPALMMRGTQIFVADSPKGPFEAAGPDARTPADWMALDGTLWEEDGVPYMVFCREWVQTGDGTMEYMPLKAGLSAPAGTPKTLFRASEAPWVPAETTELFPYPGCYVTDGCYLYRTKGGKLLMIWSSFGKDGYNIATARSESGKLAGPWIQDAEPLFCGNGGHGMLFNTFDGKLMLVFHYPNSGDTPHARLFELEDTGDSLAVLKS